MFRTTVQYFIEDLVFTKSKSDVLQDIHPFWKYKDLISTILLVYPFDASEDSFDFSRVSTLKTYMKF